MNNKMILAIAAIAVVILGAEYALAGPAGNGGFWNNMMGGYIHGGMMNGNGMMNGGSGYGEMMNENGMMNGIGIMGSGGRCGAGYATGGNGTVPITIEKAKESAEKYLTSTGNTDLALTEVIQFENNFYAGVKEKSTSTHAFELLINKYNGAAFPEMGPNMMWNTKYGHMGGVQLNETVTAEQAVELAQEYLDRNLPGTEVGDTDTFYGYYTIEVTKDGKIYGMLSVNGYTGAVWYHTWHGAFVKILEV